ncbi:MAG: DUF4897 domain-containing protein [Candidatus Caldarchaeum sp.]
MITSLFLLLMLASSQLPSYATLYIVELSADGSATWQISHAFPLASVEEVEAFRALASNMSLQSGEYLARVERLVSDAAAATGREMMVENFHVEHEVVETVGGMLGVVKVVFRWSGFAKKLDNRLEAGDVFVGGMVLLDGETLRITFPQSYRVVEVRPTPDGTVDGFLEWRGRRVFGEKEPHIVLSSSNIIPAPPSFLQNGWIMFPALFSAAAVAAVALFVKRRRRVSGDELLVERVLAVLRRHGGEMKQSQIARELGLPRSTISTVMKVLEEQRRVSRVKVGRDVIVKLQ